MNRIKILILLVMTCVMTSLAQEKITGYVIDDQSGDSLGFVTVQYKGQKITTMADHRGYFSITKQVGKKLTFSAVGYKTKTVSIGPNSHRLLVVLKEDLRSVGEVTVKAKRGKYRRKGNPAVELMRKVIANKKKTDLSNRDYYQYTKYQKLTLALNDVKPDMLTNPKFAKYPWLTDQVEKCQMTGRLILPASVDETVTQKIYRRDPHDEKTIIKGQRSVGVTNFFQTGDIVNTVSKDIFTDVNIYDNQIRILQHPFTSPIGDGAISFYRYYIEDTLAVGRDSCIHVHFLPNNQQDFGFRGDLYILKDSSYQVKRCEIILPNRSDVNFVENLKLVQEFTKLPTGEWVLSVDDMVVELVLFDFIQKGVAIRTTRLSDYQFTEIPDKMFKGREKTVMDPDAELQSTDFWQQERKVELTASEAKMDNFLKGIKSMGGFGWILAGLKVLTENFIETSEHSKIDIGPVISTISNNFIDGLRTRLGAQTTANLFPRLFWKGYVANGWKSKRWYYSSQITWALNKKKYLPEEFPKRNISFLTTYDVMSPSNRMTDYDKDNFFTSFRWTKVDKMMFYHRQRLLFEYEQRWGLRTLFSLNTEQNEAAGNMKALGYDFTKMNPADAAIPYPEINKFRTTEFTAKIRYAPGEKYMNTKQRRVKVNQDAPIFILSHTVGMKNFLGGDYNYNYTEATAYYRLWLNSWGKMELTLRAGIQWNQVPFVLLIMPEANLSFVSAPGTFSMVNNMEFLSDRYASFQMAWDMKGKIFNRVPLLRKLKLREYVGYKMMWGTLTDKNSLYLPDESYALDYKKPYMEWAVGVHNIFKILRVEYVHRMNYTDLPTAKKHGIRFFFNFTF